MLAELIDRIDSGSLSGNKMISGLDAFKLYDTFGFPLDLTQEIAEDKGFSVDVESFMEHMNQQRERARRAHEQKAGVGWEDDVLAEAGITDEFVGYKENEVSAKIMAIVKDGQKDEQALEGEQAVIVLEKTPFYAESGGQTGDFGVISVGKSAFKVEDCRKSPSGNILHIGTVVSGALMTGDTAVARIDKTRRRSVMRNHTATHLLQAALREVLGSHVHQAGSMVDADVCRFDFTHFSAVTAEQLKEVEAKVNKNILSALPVSVREMPMEEAKKLRATALFGDKYGEVVRVVEVSGASLELCGGTHVGNSAEIGLFKILSESSVAAGIRRIEGTTGKGVLKLIEDREALTAKACEALKAATPAELPAKAAATAAQLRELTKQVQDLSEKIASSQQGDTEEIGSVIFTKKEISGVNIETLRASADKTRDQFPQAVLLFTVLDEKKVAFLVSAGKIAVNSGVHAGNLVKELAKLAGGSGGGRPDSAMGGAADIDKARQAAAEMPRLIRNMLNI